MEQNLWLNATDGPLLEDPLPYRRLIGRYYMTITRPEIFFFFYTSWVNLLTNHENRTSMQLFESYGILKVLLDKAFHFQPRTNFMYLPIVILTNHLSND